MASSAFEYLTSLSAIRDRADTVYCAAQRQHLTNFDFDESRLGVTADLVTSIILESYPVDQLHSIPPHGRWQHFEVGGIPRVSRLLEQWRGEKQAVDDVECCRRLVDLFIVSVLLDAGAGNDWKYIEVGTKLKAERSEGLAVASLHMYLAGVFGEGHGTCGVVSVDGAGLRGLTVATLAEGLQVGPDNPMTGLAGRTELLRGLGDSLLVNEEIFGSTGRPGNVVDYLLNMSHDSSTLDILALWTILQRLLLPVWPQNRHSIENRPIGDAWPLSVLSRTSQMDQNGSRDSTSLASCIQPFHKLTQWLTYSLTVPFTRILGHTWTNTHLLTGLPEYRNGGLFVDMGVLTLKPHVLAEAYDSDGKSAARLQPIQQQQVFAADSDVVVEWRAMTVALLDRMLGLVNERLASEADMEKQVGEAKAQKELLSLAQMLEAGTWKAGRILAQKHRPESRASPILVRSDGTLF